MENQVEIWKSHPDIAGIEVSTLGRVRSLDKVVPSGKHTQFVKGRVLKQYNRKDGYLQACFHMNGKVVGKFVHRLVAETFLPNPENFPQVNHRDCNPSNNCVSNLEWCTPSYDAKYREKYGISRAEAQGHPLFAINLDTLEVSHFRSQGEAGRSLGFKQQSISQVIKGRIKQTGGYWFVKDDGHAIEAVKSKLHDIGGIGLKIKQGR